jgi:SAM-dependent methyltransferase
MPGPVLELGAGSGAVTRRLRAAFPDVALIAMDVDPTLLALGGTADLAVLGDAHALPLPSGSVGSVLLRYVVQHLARPVDALREVHRVLRPGGVAVVTDVDAQLWGLAEPSYPELAHLHARLASAQRRDGGDRLVGRRLTRLLRSAGFGAVQLQTFATTNDDRPVEAFEPHLGPGRLAPLLASGQMTVAEFGLAVRRWNEFRQDPDCWVLMLGFSAVAHKTTQAPSEGENP